jgi:hypothetical protein
MSLGRPLATLRGATIALFCALAAACASNPTPHPGTGSEFSDVGQHPPEGSADSDGDTTTGGTVGEVADTFVPADTVPGRADGAAGDIASDAEPDTDTDTDAGADTGDTPLREAGEAADVGPDPDLSGDGVEGAHGAPAFAARSGTRS